MLHFLRKIHRMSTLLRPPVPSALPNSSIGSRETSAVTARETVLALQMERIRFEQDEQAGRMRYGLNGKATPVEAYPYPFAHGVPVSENAD